MLLSVRGHAPHVGRALAGSPGSPHFRWKGGGGEREGGEGGKGGRGGGGGDGEGVPFHMTCGDPGPRGPHTPPHACLKCGEVVL